MNGGAMLFGITPEQLATENSLATATQEALRSEFVQQFVDTLVAMDEDFVLKKFRGWQKLAPGQECFHHD